MLQVEQLIQRVKAYQPSVDPELIQRAYDYSFRMHAGSKTRKSGQPYIVHPVGVAGILADLRLDAASVCAGLLHDVVEDTLATTDEIQKEFGTEVAELVDGVTKLSKINFTSKEDRQAENFRKMVVAMARDIRVLLIKLCDRLDNMRTLEHMTGEAQERIARETLEIYAPLANRLGIQAFKSELEDLSFKHLEPEAQAELVAQMTTTKRERDKYITARCARRSRAAWPTQGFAAEVTEAAPSISGYSFHRKMQAQQSGIEGGARSHRIPRRRRERQRLLRGASASFISQWRPPSPAGSRTTSRCRSRRHVPSRSTRRSSGPGREAHRDPDSGPTRYPAGRARHRHRTSKYKDRGGGIADQDDAAPSWHAASSSSGRRS